MRAMFQIPFNDPPTLARASKHTGKFKSFIASCLRLDPTKRLDCAELATFEFTSFRPTSPNQDPLLEKVKQVLKLKEQKKKRNADVKKEQEKLKRSIYPRAVFSGNETVRQAPPQAPLPVESASERGDWWESNAEEKEDEEEDIDQDSCYNVTIESKKHVSSEGEQPEFDPVALGLVEAGSLGVDEGVGMVSPVIPVDVGETFATVVLDGVKEVVEDIEHDILESDYEVETIRVGDLQVDAVIPVIHVELDESFGSEDDDLAPSILRKASRSSLLGENEKDKRVSFCTAVGDGDVSDIDSMFPRDERSDGVTDEGGFIERVMEYVRESLKRDWPMHLFYVSLITLLISILVKWG
jgi:hypothetical protein